LRATGANTSSPRAEQPMVVYDLSKNTATVLTANQTFCKMIGYELNEVVGMPWTEFIPQEAALHTMNTILQQKNLSSVIQLEQVYKHRTGGLFATRDTHTILFGGDGVPISDVVTLQLPDSTETDRSSSTMKYLEWKSRTSASGPRFTSPLSPVSSPPVTAMEEEQAVSPIAPSSQLGLPEIMGDMYSVIGEIDGDDSSKTARGTASNRKGVSVKLEGGVPVPGLRGGGKPRPTDTSPKKRTGQKPPTRRQVPKPSKAQVRKMEAAAAAAAVATVTTKATVPMATSAPLTRGAGISSGGRVGGLGGLAPPLIAPGSTTSTQLDMPTMYHINGIGESTSSLHNGVVVDPAATVSLTSSLPEALDDSFFENNFSNRTHSQMNNNNNNQQQHHHPEDNVIMNITHTPTNHHLLMGAGGATPQCSGAVPVSAEFGNSLEGVDGGDLTVVENALNELDLDDELLKYLSGHEFATPPTAANI